MLKSRLKIDILTLFPEMFQGPFSESLLAKAQDKKLVEIRIHNLRDFTEDKHRQVDDKQFGGGVGMVLKVEPIYKAIKKLSGSSKKKSSARPWVVYLSPQGKPLNQRIALDLSKKKHLILLCGHYEGIDERVINWVDEEISIGDYVLTGGELPAMVLTDTVCRLVPGVVKEWESIQNDSFFSSALDYAHYTRPAKFLNLHVPEALLSGHHKEIEAWRTKSALQNTVTKRPDLLKKNLKEEVEVS
jgi:tRNA (guanine37-N1)-methyltransferase